MLFSKDNIELKMVGLDFGMDSGAPCPVVISDEHKLILLYYIQRTDKDYWDGTDIKVRDSDEDLGVTCITFKDYTQVKYGWPNDEVCNGHRYYKYGIKPYAIYEVLNSDWIKKIEKGNSIHPYHSPTLFKDDKHYVFYFHDSCFEIISTKFDVEFFYNKSLNEVARLKALELYK